MNTINNDLLAPIKIRFSVPSPKEPLSNEPTVNPWVSPLDSAQILFLIPKSQLWGDVKSNRAVSWCWNESRLFKSSKGAAIQLPGPCSSLPSSSFQPRPCRTMTGILQDLTYCIQNPVSSIQHSILRGRGGRFSCLTWRESHHPQPHEIYTRLETA